jgi:deazaflavin-dependent oxidoreductase (nitroreductase family)
MGLQEDVGYVPAGANPAQRALYRLGATRAGAFFFSRTLATFDRIAYRLSGGRATVAGKIGGLPMVMLTTTGARSGQERVTPLTAIPLDEDLALIASNYGSGRIPGWAYNLRATPAATITYRETSANVLARAATGAEVEAAFAAAIRIYPGYAAYRERSGIQIPTFVLEPSPQPAT